MAKEEMRAQCPRCGALIQWAGNPYRPFCSERCKLIDLGKWVDGQYRLEGERASEVDNEKGRGGGS